MLESSRNDFTWGSRSSFYNIVYCFGYCWFEIESEIFGAVKDAGFNCIRNMWDDVESESIEKPDESLVNLGNSVQSSTTRKMTDTAKKAADVAKYKGDMEKYEVIDNYRSLLEKL